MAHFKTELLITKQADRELLLNYRKPTGSNSHTGSESFLLVGTIHLLELNTLSTQNAWGKMSRKVIEVLAHAYNFSLSLPG